MGWLRVSSASFESGDSMPFMGDRPDSREEVGSKRYSWESSRGVLDGKAVSERADDGGDLDSDDDDFPFVCTKDGGG